MTASRVSIGDIGLTPVSDGGWNYSPDFVYPDVPDRERRAMLADRLDVAGKLWLPYQCLLLDTPSGLVLVDTGSGPDDAPAGQLGLSLARAGVAPADIAVVVITHAHPDHIGGLVDADGLAFPNARHVLTETEWATWMSDEALTRLPDYLTGPARATLPALERSGLLDLVAMEAEVVPGVSLLAAPGHTAGHVGIEVISGAERAVFLADAVVDVLHFEHPDWTCAVDMVPDETVTTRRRLLEDAADHASLLLSYHVAGIGHVERHAGAFRFVE